MHTLAWKWTLEKCLQFGTRLYKWGIFSDVRSAAVGAVFGAIVGLIAAALAAQPPIETFIFTNDQGYAQPMRALLEPLKEEKEKITLTFDPSDLEQVYVCEYSHISGSSPRQVLFSYLDKYSMCLSVSQTTRSDFIVRPNLRSGILMSRNGNWFCKCGL